MERLMELILRCVSLAILVGNLCHFSALSQEAILKIDNDEHNYGVVERASALQSSFIVTNPGSKVLHLLRADAPPGVTINSSKRSIEPGDSSKITVKYIPESKGPFNKTIQLHSSASTDPYVVRIKGVLEILETDPSTNCYYFNSDGIDEFLTLNFEQRGKVINQNTKRPIPNAQILYVKGNNALYQAKSDIQGNYEKIVPIGLYDFHIEASGFEPLKQQHYVNRTTPELVFELVPDIIEDTVPEIRNDIIAENVIDEKKVDSLYPTYRTTAVVTAPELIEDVGTLSFDKFKPNNVVFLIDISSSMKDPFKMPLLKSSMITLLQSLRDVDRIAVVTYATTAQIHIPSTIANKKEELALGIDTLVPKGRTAGGEGIHLAYTVAKKNYIEGGNNQIILATDGAFELPKSDEKLFQSSTSTTDYNVHLSVVGFGSDEPELIKMLRSIAKKGSGNFIHIQNTDQAKVALLEEIKISSKRF